MHKSLNTSIENFNNTKSSIVGSALGKALGMSTSTKWAAVVSTIQGVPYRGSLQWADITAYNIPAGYYDAWIINPGPADINGYNRGYNAGFLAAAPKGGMLAYYNSGALHISPGVGVDYTSHNERAMVVVTIYSEKWEGVETIYVTNKSTGGRAQHSLAYDKTVRVGVVGVYLASPATINFNATLAKQYVVQILEVV